MLAEFYCHYLDFYYKKCLFLDLGAAVRLMAQVNLLFVFLVSSGARGIEKGKGGNTCERQLINNFDYGSAQFYEANLRVM